MNVQTRLLLPCLLGLLTLAAPAATRAATLKIAQDGSGQYTKIQDAVNAAAKGDTVLVADGTYSGDGNRDIDFKGKNITVSSQNGPTKTVIDCQGSALNPHRGFIFYSGETTSAAVDGFTIENGYGSAPQLPTISYGYSAGGGILIVQSSPTISDCIFNGNSATFGGGVEADFSSRPILKNCTFRFNTVTNYGGGMETGFDSTPVLTNCVFSTNTGNYGGAGVDISEGTALLFNCTFADNTSYYGGGGGLSVSNTSTRTPILTNCTFANNHAYYGDDVEAAVNGYANFTNCVFWNSNAGDSGVGIYVYQYDPAPSSVNVTFSDIQGGYPGTNNIDKDPLFVNAATGDLHIKPNSPCRGAGNHIGAPATDLDGMTRPNPPSMGAYDLQAFSLVTNAKLGQPQFMGSPDAGNCAVVIPLYLKGAVAGTAHVNGHWIYRGKSLPFTADTDFPAVGDWSPAGSFSIPWPSVQGNWVLRFAVDGSSISSGVINASITGFHPALNGWKFTNNFSDTNPNNVISNDGLCFGMSHEAWSDYQTGMTIPSITKVTKPLFSQLVKSQLLNMAKFVKDGLRADFSYSSDSEEIKTEANRISQHLTSGQPWVVGLLPTRVYTKSLPGGHAVVATGVFDCLNVYLQSSPNQISNDHEFCTYDPNDPLIMHYMDVLDSQATYSLDFVPNGTGYHDYYPVEYTGN